MRNIPDIAYGHHEKLNGEGYPRGIHGDEIAIQTRMMTVSDIYDALTASDRPYKRPCPPEGPGHPEPGSEGKKLDAELVKVFIEAKIWEKKRARSAERSAPRQLHDLVLLGEGKRLTRAAVSSHTPSRVSDRADDGRGDAPLTSTAQACSAPRAAR